MSERVDRLLRLADVAAEYFEALLGVGKRQQVVQVGPADRAPSQVLGDQHRLYPLDQRSQAAEMNAVELLGAPQRERNRMDAHRVVGAQFEQSVQRRRLSHVALGVHLDEAQVGPRGRDFPHMRKAQADPRIAVALRWMLRNGHGSGTAFVG